jgi:phosphatidylglycerol---prolipoprotein diacylglyceryl transferase
MIPFLHLGPLTVPTFGLMVATALLVSAYLLQADLNRRRAQLEHLPGYVLQRDEGFVIIGIAGICGIIGARLYHVLEDPGALAADPAGQLFSRYGFAWFGGFLGGLLALIFLARRSHIPLLLFFDICSPAACVGYAVGRIGCLLSGDGDYGIPTKLPWGMSFPNGVVPTTGPWDPVSHSGVCSKYGLPESCAVHPTPIYEFFIFIGIACFLWWMGSKSLKGPKATGEIFANYLILTGIARFLIEFIRINPRSFFGFSNAQAASLVSIAVGAVLLWRLKSTWHTRKSTASSTTSR